MNKLLIPNTCQVPNVLLDEIIPSLPVAMPELPRGLPSRSDKRSELGDHPMPSRVLRLHR